MTTKSSMCHHKEKPFSPYSDGGARISIPSLADTLHTVLEEEASALARETGFIQRERQLSGADFAQTLIFGWLQEPEVTLGGLTQIAQRRDVTISAGGLCQRFSEEAATFLRRLLARLTQVRLEGEAARVALLKRFTAVIVEDSSYLSVPEEVAACWAGEAEQPESRADLLKLFVRWDVLSGTLHGPLLTPGRQADGRSPLDEEELPAGSLYLADLGFFGLERLRQLARRRREGKGDSLRRLGVGTALSTRSGHRLDLRGLLPAQEGASVELGVLLGQRARLPTRLLMQRVSKEVAEQPRQRIRDDGRDRGQEPSEWLLYLAHWTIVVSHVPRRLLSLEESLVVLRVRWQIERLFRLWKEDGRIDEWRSKKRWRIVCELCAKLAAMLIQQWVIQIRCWHDPRRSLVKAAQVLRREANRLMVGLWDDTLEHTLREIVRCLGSGCRLEQRQQYPSTAQRLEGAPVRGGLRRRRPSPRQRHQVRRWSAGKGWASSKPGRTSHKRVVSLT
jgi:hypothetical protein